jgi:hypothetical protein
MTNGATRAAPMAFHTPLPLGTTTRPPLRADAEQGTTRPLGSVQVRVVAPGAGAD